MSNYIYAESHGRAWLRRRAVATRTVSATDDTDFLSRAPRKPVERHLTDTANCIDVTRHCRIASLAVKLQYNIRSSLPCRVHLPWERSESIVVQP